MKSLRQPPPSQPDRRTWTLWILAIPIALACNMVGGYWDPLVNAVLALAGSPPDPSRLQMRLAGMTAHTLIPTFLAFCLLRSTRLGAWLAPNRLALGAFLLVDSLLIIVGTYGTYMVAIGGSPYLSHMAVIVLSPVAMACLIVGSSCLALSTFWHRTTPRGRLLSFRLLRWLWREI